MLLITEVISTPLSAEVGQGLTDAAETEPLGVASAEPLGVTSADKPKTSIPKSSSADIPATSAAAGSSSFKTSSGFVKVHNNDLPDL